MVDNLQIVARQTYAALHVVLAAVHRTIHHLSEIFRMLVYHTASQLNATLTELVAVIFLQRCWILLLETFDVATCIVIRILHIVGNSVASREVEHNDVIAFNLTESFQTTIFVFRMVEIALCVDYRKRVLTKRKVDWSDRHTRPVAHLVDPQIVAHKKRFLQ